MDGVEETVLVYRVLERAIVDFHSKSKHVKNSATRWFDDIQDGDDMTAPEFSFMWCCQVLNVKPEKIIEVRNCRIQSFTLYKKNSKFSHKFIHNIFEDQDDTNYIDFPVLGDDE